MTSDNPTAEIYDMEDARARRRSTEASGAGAQLAEAREAAGLTLAEAAAKTHIKEHHLQAIEETDLTALPPRPYVVGFVRGYAEFLRLDAAMIVERFKQDAGFFAPPTVDVEKFETAATASEPGRGELSLAAVVVILAFFIWCAWQITLLDGEKIVAPGAGLPGASASPGGQAGFEPQAEAAPPVQDNVIEARLIERIEPVYPMGCLTDAHEVETVTVMFNITAAGRVSGLRAAQSSAACFEQAALNAVRRWRFDPRTVDGAPRTAYDQRVSFRFTRPY